MGLFDWFRPKKTVIELKASQVGSMISGMGVGTPAWTTRDYAGFAEEGYQQNSVAFRCIKMISSNAATVPWLLYDKSGNELDSHPLLDLLRNPNPLMAGGAFFEAVYSYLLIAGNSYIERVDARKKPKELWTHRPDRMKVIVGQRGMPAGYQYSVNGQVKDTWEVDQLTGKGPILHLKEFNPLDDWYGQSRMEAAAYGVDRHNAASIHNKALLDNGARPSGALIYEPLKVGPETFEFAPEESIREAKTRLTENNTGPVNAGKPMVLGGLIKWESMGITPRDMDFNEGKDDAARDICAAFGVPHLLIVPGSSTYNNVQLAKLDLWEDTILPLVDRLVEGVNMWLAPQYEEGLRLGVDLDEISALEPRRQEKRKSTADLYKDRLIDHSEAREALQYEPKPEMVQAPDATVIQALVAAVPSAGVTALVNYLRSVGLLDAAATDEAAMAAAEAFIDRLGPTEEETAPVDPGAAEDKHAPIN